MKIFRINLYLKFFYYLSSIFQNQSNYEKKIRAHDDGIEFSITSPEAFEEVFWKSQINLAKNNNILTNDINTKIIKNFKDYLFLVTLKDKKKSLK